ncbi:MAG: hypothetical protein J6M53_06770 [Bacteroidaceae bacterium]|nr:hypothetical protein [Bacteroidaceae bacterium]
MKKLLPLLLLLALPLTTLTSCEDDPWEEEMMGEYESDDGSVYFVLSTRKNGYVEYGDGQGYEFTWWASKDRLYFYPLGYESFSCRYRWTRGGELVIFDFDQWGDLYLYPLRFYHSRQAAPDAGE